MLPMLVPLSHCSHPPPVLLSHGIIITTSIPWACDGKFLSPRFAVRFGILVCFRRDAAMSCVVNGRRDEGGKRRRVWLNSADPHFPQYLLRFR